MSVSFLRLGSSFSLSGNRVEIALGFLNAKKVVSHAVLEFLFRVDVNKKHCFINYPCILKMLSGTCTFRKLYKYFDVMERISVRFWLENLATNN